MRLTEFVRVISYVVPMCFVGACSDNLGGKSAASTQRSATLAQFGDFATVPSNWNEKYDPIDGPKKLLAYANASQTSSHVFVTSCEDGHIVFLVGTGDGGSFPFDQRVNVSINLDDRGAEKQRWVAKAGYKGISPGSGTSADASKFLESLLRHGKLAIRADDWGDGMAVDAAAEVFDITGVDAVIANLKAECSA